MQKNWIVSHWLLEIPMFYQDMEHVQQPIRNRIMLSLCYYYNKLYFDRVTHQLKTVLPVSLLYPQNI